MQCDPPGAHAPGIESAWYAMLTTVLVASALATMAAFGRESRLAPKSMSLQFIFSPDSRMLLWFVGLELG